MASAWNMTELVKVNMTHIKFWKKYFEVFELALLRDKYYVVKEVYGSEMWWAFMSDVSSIALLPGKVTERKMAQKIMLCMKQVHTEQQQITQAW